MNLKEIESNSKFINKNTLSNKENDMICLKEKTDVDSIFDKNNTIEEENNNHKENREEVYEEEKASSIKKELSSFQKECVLQEEEKDKSVFSHNDIENRSESYRNIKDNKTRSLSLSVKDIDSIYKHDEVVSHNHTMNNDTSQQENISTRSTNNIKETLNKDKKRDVKEPHFVFEPTEVSQKSNKIIIPLNTPEKILIHNLNGKKNHDDNKKEKKIEDFLEKSSFKEKRKSLDTSRKNSTRSLAYSDIINKENKNPNVNFSFIKNEESSINEHKGLSYIVEPASPIKQNDIIEVFDDKEKQIRQARVLRVEAATPRLRSFLKEKEQRKESNDSVSTMNLREKDDRKENKNEKEIEITNHNSYLHEEDHDKRFYVHFINLEKRMDNWINSSAVIRKITKSSVIANYNNFLNINLNYTLPSDKKAMKSPNPQAQGKGSGKVRKSFIFRIFLNLQAQFPIKT